MVDDVRFPGAFPTGSFGGQASGYAFNDRKDAEAFCDEFGIDHDNIEHRGVSYYVDNGAERLNRLAFDGGDGERDASGRVRRFDTDTERGFGETDRFGRSRSAFAGLSPTGQPSSSPGVGIADARPSAFVDAHPAVPPNSQPVPASETLRAGDSQVVDLNDGTVVDTVDTGDLPVDDDR